jgi:hypothetical protein
MGTVDTSTFTDDSSVESEGSEEERRRARMIELEQVCGVNNKIL